MTLRSRLRTLWPATLAGRLAWILFGGLLLAHALTLGFVLAERGLAVRGMMADYLARDLASSVAILERLPPAERAHWLPRLERRNYRFALDAAQDEGAPDTSSLGAQLQSALSAALARDVRPARRSAGGLQLRIALADGAPVTVLLEPQRMRLADWLLAALAAQFAGLCLLAWLAVRQATRPLARLADAADALDLGGEPVPLPADGPREVARAAAAFNAMQRRIRGHLAERTQILAAVSHDLQTPLTRLRLRVEMMDEGEQRGRLQADLEAMEALVREGIAYARSAERPQEPAQPVDLHALLDSLACDYADAGQAVTLQAPRELQATTRPQALRRIVTNLVDNALKFAGTAQIEAWQEAQRVTVTVRDRGPGIPPGELQAVLQPFYRLEHSRGRESGGTGLGLAIAQQLAQALGGSLSLRNHEEGGLEARLELPLQDQAAAGAACSPLRISSVPGVQR